MAGAKDASELNSAASKAAKVAKLRVVREAEEAKKVEKAASAAEKFRSEIDVLKQRAREVPRTLTDDEIRACEAVKLQMKGKLPEPGKVSVAEVEKIDEAVRAANAADDAKLASETVANKEMTFVENSGDNKAIESSFLPEEYYNRKYKLRPPLISDGCGNIKLYRTISEVEYGEIMVNKKFSTIPGAMLDKWFSTKIEDAHAWGRKMDFGKNYKIIEITLPEPLVDKLFYGGPNLDGIGPAYCASLEVINEYSSTIKLIE